LEFDEVLLSDDQHVVHIVSEEGTTLDILVQGYSVEACIQVTHVAGMELKPKSRVYPGEHITYQGPAVWRNSDCHKVGDRPSSSREMSAKSASGDGESSTAPQYPQYLCKLSPQQILPIDFQVSPDSPSPVFSSSFDVDFSVSGVLPPDVQLVLRKYRSDLALGFILYSYDGLEYTENVFSLSSSNFGDGAPVAVENYTHSVTISADIQRLYNPNHNLKNTLESTGYQFKPDYYAILDFMVSGVTSFRFLLQCHVVLMDRAAKNLELINDADEAVLQTPKQNADDFLLIYEPSIDLGILPVSHRTQFSFTVKNCSKTVYFPFVVGLTLRSPSLSLTSTLKQRGVSFRMEQHAMLVEPEEEEATAARKDSSQSQTSAAGLTGQRSLAARIPAVQDALHNQMPYRGPSARNITTTVSAIEEPLREASPDQGASPEAGQDKALAKTHPSTLKTSSLSEAATSLSIFSTPALENARPARPAPKIKTVPPEKVLSSLTIPFPNVCDVFDQTRLMVQQASQATTDFGGVVSICPSYGIIPPGAEMVVHVSLTPLAAGFLEAFALVHTPHSSYYLDVIDKILSKIDEQRRRMLQYQDAVDERVLHTSYLSQLHRTLPESLYYLAEQRGIPSSRPTSLSPQRAAEERRAARASHRSTRLLPDKASKRLIHGSCSESARSLHSSLGADSLPLGTASQDMLAAAISSSREESLPFGQSDASPGVPRYSESAANVEYRSGEQQELLDPEASVRFTGDPELPAASCRVHGVVTTPSVEFLDANVSPGDASTEPAELRVLNSGLIDTHVTLATLKGDALLIDEQALHDLVQQIDLPQSDIGSLPHQYVMRCAKKEVDVFLRAGETTTLRALPGLDAPSIIIARSPTSEFGLAIGEGGRRVYDEEFITADGQLVLSAAVLQPRANPPKPYLYFESAPGRKFDILSPEQKNLPEVHLRGRPYNPLLIHFVIVNPGLSEFVAEIAVGLDVVAPSAIAVPPHSKARASFAVNPDRSGLVETFINFHDCTTRLIIASSGPDVIISCPHIRRAEGLTDYQGMTSLSARGSRKGGPVSCTQRGTMTGAGTGSLSAAGGVSQLSGGRSATGFLSNVDAFASPDSQNLEDESGIALWERYATTVPLDVSITALSPQELLERGSDEGRGDLELHTGKVTEFVSVLRRQTPSDRANALDFANVFSAQGDLKTELSERLPYILFSAAKMADQQARGQAGTRVANASASLTCEPAAPTSRRPTGGARPILTRPTIKLSGQGGAALQGTKAAQSGGTPTTQPQKAPGAVSLHVYNPTGGEMLVEPLVYDMGERILRLGYRDDGGRIRLAPDGPFFRVAEQWPDRTQQPTSGWHSPLSAGEPSFTQRDAKSTSQGRPLCAGAAPHELPDDPTGSMVGQYTGHQGVSNAFVVSPKSAIIPSRGFAVFSVTPSPDLISGQKHHESLLEIKGLFVKLVYEVPRPAVKLCDGAQILNLVGSYEADTKYELSLLNESPTAPVRLELEIDPPFVLGPGESPSLTLAGGESRAFSIVLPAVELLRSTGQLAHASSTQTITEILQAERRSVTLEGKLTIRYPDYGAGEPPPTSEALPSGSEPSNDSESNSSESAQTRRREHSVTGARGVVPPFSHLGSAKAPFVPASKCTTVLCVVVAPTLLPAYSKYVFDPVFLTKSAETQILLTNPTNCDCHWNIVHVPLMDSIAISLQRKVEIPPFLELSQATSAFSGQKVRTSAEETFGEGSSTLGSVFYDSVERTLVVDNPGAFSFSSLSGVVPASGGKKPLVPMRLNVRVEPSKGIVHSSVTKDGQFPIAFIGVYYVCVAGGQGCWIVLRGSVEESAEAI